MAKASSCVSSTKARWSSNSKSSAWKRICIARSTNCIDLPHGIVLVTGPTGSGKTTTLYSALLEIRSDDTKIITTEDPVEYQLDGINQIQVHAKIGLTFAASLRSILRHDPDIVLVGEIRDQETAENAIQASLTGHLVFSTLHTNDAAGAYTRMIDMGVEPFLRRQHRRRRHGPATGAPLCTQCKEAYTPPEGRSADRFSRETNCRKSAANCSRPRLPCLPQYRLLPAEWAFTNCC